ncbi:MAG: hypothetical protein GY832_32180 [Chloroflexi bacterium]|nr:hypothetical protein [Chloroflexota bacterium]
MPHQAAQVDKVFLRGGSFFLGDVAPYGDEFLGGEGGAQWLLLWRVQLRPKPSIPALRNQGFRRILPKPHQTQAGSPILSLPQFFERPGEHAAQCIGADAVHDALVAGAQAPPFDEPRALVEDGRADVGGSGGQDYGGVHDESAEGADEEQTAYLFEVGLDGF